MGTLRCDLGYRFVEELVPIINRDPVNVVDRAYQIFDGVSVAFELLVKFIEVEGRDVVCFKTD